MIPNRVSIIAELTRPCDDKCQYFHRCRPHKCHPCKKIYVESQNKHWRICSIVSVDIYGCIFSTDTLFFQSCHDVILEAVFPSAAIFRLMDKTLRDDADVRNGEHVFIVLTNLLSKPLSSFQFPLVSSNAMSESSCLEYAPEGCESGHTRLLVSDKEVLMDHLGLDDYIIEELDCQHWLHTPHLHTLM